MESHASASMYIPSSKVLARLQRHATAMDGSKASNVGVSGGSGLPATSGALSPESSGGSNLFEADPKTATTDTLAALSTASAKMDGAAVLVERSATVSKPSGAAGTSPSAHGAPSTFSASPTSNNFPTRALPPSESITSGAALGAHAAASDAARPPSMLKSPTAFTVASSQMRGSHTNSSRAVREVPMAVEIREAAPQRLPSPAETSSSPALSPSSASSPTASAWLLPQEDVTYILASLTWNVDLLRLLLPHAPCPLRLPGAEPPAETPCSAAGGPAAATAQTSAPASATPRSIDVKEEEASTEAAQEGLAAKSVAKSSTCEAAAGTLLSPLVDKLGDTSSATSKMSTRAAYGQEAYVTRDNSAASTAVAPNPRSLPPSPTSSSAPTTSVAVSGNSEAVPTGPLTWSQYLFRGAGRGGVRAVMGRERNTSTCMLGDGAAGPPQQPLWFARGQATPTELVQGVHKGLPHSHSDGALVLDPKTSAGTPTAAPNSPYVSSSIFHAQYLPSLEEFQRKLEEHKHRQQLLLREQQQQQQQRMPTLSATRLQKHLQQQQQQHESPHHHYRRRAAANKMFFYSPTPSVVSLATTAATTAVNTNTTDENCKEELKPCQPSGVCPSSLPPSPSVSSASPARRGLPNSQRLLGRSGLCLRPCTSSTSLDNLVNGGGSSSDNEVTRVGIGATAATSCMSYSTPDSSCPSPPRPQQLSVMRLRAADQLRGFTVSSSAQGQSPLLLYAGDGRSASRNSRGSSRATAPDDRDGNGEENGEDEEWASICRGISGSGGVRPSISLPASPTVSISSMSFSRVWSSTLSGRATPRTTLATGVGSTVATHHSNFNSGNLSCVGYASPYATSKGRKNARRRRKTACTRRRRIMRVFVPSITEGPKAASLYTAPTAEAQELLLQLQHRAAPSFVSGSTGKLIGGHSAASTAVSAAWPRTTTSATPPVTPSCGTAASPRPSTFAEAAHANSRSSGNPAGVPTAGQAERPQHGFTRPNVGSPRPPRNSGEAAPTPQLLTLPQPLRSHETAADLFSASWSSVAAAPPSAAAAEPTSRSFTSSGSNSHGKPDDFCEEVGGAGRSDGPVKALEDTSTETHQQQWSAPPSAAEPVAPLELPQWVRERPLSALYYQPWGLKLLARYEASRHEQQLRRARMLRRVGPGVCSNTTTAGAAVSEVRVNRNNSSPATSMCSSSSGGGTSPYMMSSPAAQTAAQHAPVLSRPSLGTSRGSCPSTATAAGAGNTSSPSSSGTPHVSWAAALRQARCGNRPSGSSAEFSSATAAASTLTETAAADLIPPQSLRQLPAVVPDWPPELSAAEERDAWEEAYYFGWVSVAPSLSQQPHLPGRRSTTSHRDRASSDSGKGYPQGKHGASATDVEGCVGGSSGQVQRIGSHTPATCSVAASPAALKRQQWWLDAEVQPPTLYLNRQRRSSRRRSRVAYPSDMFRSSTARRAGATSAAAELFGRHKDAHPTSAADATAAAPTSMKAVGNAVPVPTEGADLPASSSHTRASCVTRSQLTLYNDGPPRKKAAQLFYPAPSLHGVGVPPPSPFTKHDHRTISQVTVGTEAMECGSGVAHAQQHQQHMEVDSSAAEDGQVKIEVSAVQPRRSAIEQVVEKSCCDGGEEEAGAAGSGLGWQLPARSGADGPHCSSSNLTCDATDSTAATPACIPEAAAPVDMTAPRPCADVDVIFFLQKFVRAVLIVFIAQVRLQQLQEQQELELHVDHHHSSTCPAEACLLGRHGGRAIPSDPAAATAAAEVPYGVGLSKLERSALSFVRHYMADYRHMITTYVMRNDREVARRSAQAILTPPQSTAAALSTSPPSTVGATDAAGREASSAPDPLFQQALLARWLRADRVNTVYEEAVSVATGGVSSDADANPPATPVDDVEPLRVAQVYISGKDAAWQPLLMELLRVRRVVQCYSDGPVVAATGSASATSPQRLLLASLEKFLVQPTLPLLRRAGSSGSEVTQAGSTTPASPAAPSTSTTTAAVSGSPASDLCTATALSLTPAQAVAAALMVEESDAFRAYLLSGYLREDAAADGNSTTAGTDFAAKTATMMLRHSQSAPTLTATGVQQWPYSSVSPAAAMPSFTVGHAMSSHPQPQQPQSPNLLLNSGSLLQPLTWYPYAYMPGTANPYAENVDPYTAHTAPAPAAAASAMTLSVAMLPLSGRLLWRWVVPAEDTDNFNLSVFFQSSLFSFMQGGPLPMPSAPPDWLDAAAGTAAGRGAVGYVPTPMAMRMAPSLSPHPSLAWPPALAARIDAQLRDDAFRSAWDGVLSSCTCGTAASAVHKDHGSGSGLWGEMPEVTLVHCSAGMHRSCGILVAFLLWLLYQCRQVLCTEKALGLGPLSCTGVPAPPLPAGTEITHAAAVKSLLLDDVDALAPAAASAGDGEDEEQLEQRTKNTAAEADTPWLTSRLLRRTIRHVQQQRSIAVPIRTVQYLLQSFANELRLP